MNMRVKPVDSNNYGFRFGELYPNDKKKWGSLAGKRHLGLDIIAPSGTAIRCPERGVFVWQGYGNAGGYQCHLIGESGALHRFLHMLGPSILEINQTVEAGQPIGNVGSTGQSTGPHLHWDISANSKLSLNDFTNFIDPLKWLIITSQFVISREAIEALYTMINQVPTENEIQAHLKAPSYLVLYSGFFAAYKQQIIKAATELIQTLENRP